MKEASHKRPHSVWVHLHAMWWTGKSVETESMFEVALKWKIEGELGMTDNGYEFSFGNEENIIKLIVMMGADLCEYTKKYWFIFFYLTCYKCSENIKGVVSYFGGCEVYE